MATDTRMKSDAQIQAEQAVVPRLQAERAANDEKLRQLKKNALLHGFEAELGIEGAKAQFDAVNAEIEALKTRNQYVELFLQEAAKRAKEAEVARHLKQIEKRCDRHDEVAKEFIRFAKEVEKVTEAEILLEKLGRELADKYVLALPTPTPPGFLFGWSFLQDWISNHRDRFSEEFIGGSPGARAPFRPIGAKAFKIAPPSDKAAPLSDRVREMTEWVGNYARSHMHEARLDTISVGAASVQTARDVAKVEAKAAAAQVQPERKMTEAEATAMHRAQKTGFKLTIDTRKGGGQ